MAISTIGASALDSGVSQLGKNLIQNGSFVVAQRGTSFTGLGTAAAYTLDRWKVDINGSPQARVTITQDTDVPSGQGFASSLKIDVTTAESAAAAGETFHVFQNIEAQNLQLLAYNTASAKTMALSFWFKSPKSGTHCVTIDNQDGGSTYIREFTVASADTWEKHSVTFPGDTAAGINNDNGTGLTLIFPLINGTTYQGTANTWTGSGTQWSTSNQQNLLDNTANNIYIAGVQLEVGSVATDFEHENYGTTLAKCQRYFRNTIQQSGVNKHMFHGVAYNTTRVWMHVDFQPPMRGAVTAGYTGTASQIYIRYAGGTNGIGSTGTPSIQGSGSDGSSIEFLLDIASGTPFTVGEGIDVVMVGGSGGSANSFYFDAEL
jgi:hypothetical protein